MLTKKEQITPKANKKKEENRNGSGINKIENRMSRNAMKQEQTERNSAQDVGASHWLLMTPLLLAKDIWGQDDQSWSYLPFSPGQFDFIFFYSCRSDEKHQNDGIQVMGEARPGTLSLAGPQNWV